MRVRIRGEEVTLAAVRPQLEGADSELIEDQGARVDLEVVAAGDTGPLREANRAAIDADRTAILVELGGVGGQPFREVDGAIVTVSNDGPCYRCLELRVDAASDDDGSSTGLPTAEMRRIMGAVAGQRAVVGSDADGTTTLLEFPWTERSLHPVPGCPACDNDGRWSPSTRNEGRSRSLEEAVAAAETVIDERVGVVSSIGEADSLPLPYYLATLADTEPFSDVAAPRQAAGVADDWNRALMKAVGEALERYAAGVYRDRDFRRSAAAAMDDAIEPSAFVRPTDWDPITGDLPWLPGTSLRDGEHRWVPAELVVFPPPHRDIRPAITTGLALGNSPSEARAVGLAEVIERDAAMLAWYSTFEPLGVRVDDQRFDRLVRRAGVENLEVTAALLTQDVDLPVIAAAVHRPDPFPRFAIGSAAGLDPTEAAIDALREAIQNWMELASMGEATAREQAPRITRYATDPGGAGDFMDPDAWLDAGTLGEEPEDRLEALVERAGDAGLHPLAVPTTTRDLDRIGFHGTRVLVPSAQPLFTGSAYFGDRAEEVPRSLGFEPQLDRTPHPFP